MKEAYLMREVGSVSIDRVSYADNGFIVQSMTVVALIY